MPSLNLKISLISFSPALCKSLSAFFSFPFSISSLLERINALKARAKNSATSKDALNTNLTPSTSIAKTCAISSAINLPPKFDTHDSSNNKINFCFVKIHNLHEKLHLINLYKTKKYPCETGISYKSKKNIKKITKVC